MTTHATLYAQWLLAKRLQEGAQEAERRARRTAYEAELRLYEAEGRSQLRRPAWIRALLAGDTAECDRILATVTDDAWYESTRHRPPILVKAP